MSDYKDYNEEEYKKIVNDVLAKTHSAMLNTLKAYNADPKANWLIVGRVLSALFSNHFKMSMKLSEQSMNEVMNDIEKPTT